MATLRHRRGAGVCAWAGRFAVALGLATLTSLVAAPAALGTTHPAPVAARSDPGREVVAIVGDSLSENADLSDPARQALGPALRAALVQRGLDPGGAGFVPAHPATAPGPSTPSEGWRIAYTGRWLVRSGALPDMRSGLESRSSDPRATASFRSDDDATAALFGAVAGRPARVHLSAGPRGAAVNATPGRLRLAWAPGRGRRIVGLRLLRGAISLAGFFGRRAVAGRRQVEISMLVRGGALAADPLLPFDRAGIGALRPRLTVIALGTNDAIKAAFGDRRAEDRMAAGLTHLAQVARGTGRCTVVLPPRAPIIASVADRMTARIARVGRAAGCHVGDPWRQVLDQPGYRAADDLHPTAAGVRAMADALLPELT